MRLQCRRGYRGGGRWGWLEEGERCILFGEVVYDEDDGRKRRIGSNKEAMGRCFAPP